MIDAAAIVRDRECAAPSCPCHRPPRRSAAGLTWRTHCPVHGDDHPSLDITETPAGKILVVCRSAKCAQADVIEALRTRGLWTVATSYGDAPAVRYFVYTDEHGTPLHRTARVGDGPGKRIWQEYCVDGRWMKRKPAGQRLVLYRLPDLLAAPASAILFVVEGEKNADDLRAIGCVATTNPLGAGKWRAEFTPHLAGHLVAVIADHDAPGEAHAQAVVASLLASRIAVVLIRLPGVPEGGGDVSDWLAAGGTKEALEVFVDQTVPSVPAPPVDPAELDRELDVMLAAVRDTTTWSFRREGDDFRFWFPDKARIAIRHLRERGDGLIAEITVEHAAYGLVDHGPLSLGSRSSLDGLRKTLERKASGLAWEHHLDHVCHTVLEQFRRIPAAIVAADIPLRPLELGVAPFFILDEGNVLYGTGGTGKSLLLQAVAAGLVMGAPVASLRPHPDLCGPVGYLDYETSAGSFRRRLSDVTQALGLPEQDVLRQVVHQRLARPLTHCTDDLRALVARYGLRTLIIDSLKAAAGPSTTGDPGDVAGTVFAAIRALDRTALIIAHPPRQSVENGMPPNVYASVFNENLPRSVVYAKRLGDRADRVLRLSLQQTKDNEGLSPAPLGLAFEREVIPRDGFTQYRVFAIRSCDLTAEPAAQTSDWARIRAVMLRERRMLTVAEIAETLPPMSERVVRARLSGHAREVVSGPEPHGTRGAKVYGLRSSQEETE